MSINFEEIVSEPPARLPRQYRECAISDYEYWRVCSNRGASSNFGTSGSGYTNWYMYHTMNNRIVCVINSGNYWSWQYDGVPSTPLVIRSRL